MANSNIPALTTIATPSSAAMMWINDPNASPQDRSLKVSLMFSVLRAMGALGTNWPASLLANLPTDWMNALILPLQKRIVTTTSGALGALTDTDDHSYYLSGASTATLPAIGTAVIGQRITFKNKGAFTTTILAAAGQTIGTTTSTSFALYAQEDRVTFEYDGTSIWYVVDTNGPVQVSHQTGGGALSTTGSWAALGNGLSVSLSPGVYDIDLIAHMQTANPNQKTAIGNALIPISDEVYSPTYSTAAEREIFNSVRNYPLLAPATIQGIYYQVTLVSPGLLYDATYNIGCLRIRRVG